MNDLVIVPTNQFKVGDIVPVGSFQWIETGIGFAENASHGISRDSFKLDQNASSFS